MADCPLCGHVTPCGRHAPSAAPLDVETFIAGLDSPNHSPESRRAWIELFFADMHRAYDRAPDPLVSYTDPAGGPDWEPRSDEA